MPAVNGNVAFHYNPIAQLSGDPGVLFPVLAEDQARNLYAVWVQADDFQVRFPLQEHAQPGSDHRVIFRQDDAYIFHF